MPPWGYAPSLGYSDGDAHGGFKPNTTFPHGTPQRSSPTGFSHDPRTPSPAFNAGLNTQYNYSPLAYSSALPVAPLRRGALSFVPSSVLQFNHTDADMDKIITSGSVVAASCPRFGVQDETMDTANNIDDELDDAEEEGGVVSIDQITGANQNADTYWGRIKTVFDERKLVDPDFANIHMDRGDKAMANPWATIQTACNKWHGIVEEVAARPKSGANVKGQVWT
ncbi:putative methionyl-tRNA synthetase [Hordeum vulgare]|nr:putative methionyl-tRNA synthetase [Hordeum vulgare]